MSSSPFVRTARGGGFALWKIGTALAVLIGGGAFLYAATTEPPAPKEAHAAVPVVVPTSITPGTDFSSYETMAEDEKPPAVEAKPVAVIRTATARREPTLEEQAIAAGFPEGNLDRR